MCKIISMPVKLYLIVKRFKQPFNLARPARLLMVFLCLLGIGACTNSKLVIGTLYDRLDDQIRGEFNKLGKFTDEQKSEFELRLQTFHYWHRRQELPKYANLLRSIANSVETKNATTESDIKLWFDSIEQYADAGQACYPVHYSLDLVKQLRNDQVDFIERRFNSERRKNRARYNSETREERMQTRLENIDKWSSRVGFELTNRQKRMMLSTMRSTKSLHKQYYEVSERWNRRTFAVVRMRHTPAFNIEMKTQLDGMFRQMETHYPKELAGNRDIWRQFAFEFVGSMTNNQRVWARAWLKKLAKNLDKISAKKVNFQPHDNAALGCLAQTKS